MAETSFQRLSEKTIERQFIYELEHDFELAPATSRAVLSAAQQVLVPLYDGREVLEGQMRLTVVGAGEPAGKSLAEMQKVGVVLTVDGGIEDLDIQHRFGLRGLRRARLLRITEEAVDQGGVLTQEDLSRVLQTGVRTIRRDVASLRGGGYWVPTRGAVQEMGRGQSHKAKIVELYLQRKTFTEIMRETRHSSGAIKRYVQTFGRVLVLWEKGIQDVGEVAYIAGISVRLAGAYHVLRERYDRPRYRDRLDEIARQVRCSLPGGGEEKRGS